MTQPVIFDLETESGSLERARTTDREVILDPSGESYLVAFKDGEHVHDVTLNRTPDGWEADCLVVHRDDDKFKRCPGLAHHDGPCAHVWAVRSHVARKRRRDEDSQYDHAIEKARADGGRSIR